MNVAIHTDGPKDFGWKCTRRIAFEVWMKMCGIQELPFEVLLLIAWTSMLNSRWNWVRAFWKGMIRSNGLLYMFWICDYNTLKQFLIDVKYIWYNYRKVNITNFPLLYCWMNSVDFTGLQLRNELPWDSKFGKYLLLASYAITFVSHIRYCVNFRFNNGLDLSSILACFPG